jgi:hypothetical protein
VDICLLGLADYLAKTDFPPKQDEWVLNLDRVAVFLEGWFVQKDSWVEPVRLLRGEDIMSAFHLSSGRLVGKVLEAIKEAQASGEIANREEALEFAQTIINSPARKTDE